jgi:ATP-dependent DNA helicase RecG
MDPDGIKRLISNGEDLNIEFKGENKNALNDSDLVEAVVCLANRPSTESGWLLIGVEDDGTISGAKPRLSGGRIDVHQIQALIANRTRPSISCKVELIDMDEGKVMIIEVPPSKVPTSTTDGKFQRRKIGGKGKPECVPLDFSDMLGLQSQRCLQDYSSFLVEGATWDDLDPLEFERFRRIIRENRGKGDFALSSLSDIELAKSIGAIDADRDIKSIKVLGLLLFGKEDSLTRLVPSHEVAFQVISDTRIQVNDFFRWPLIRLMEELSSRFRARNREEELMVNIFRIGIPDYSEQAFREGLANALIHRDYSKMGCVHIQWYDDRIEISNPGGFPEGVRLDNILSTPPRPRNPCLADAFKRAGIVERTGRGIDTIFYEQLRNGRPAPSYDRSSSTDVVLALPGGKSNLNFVRLIVEQNQSGNPLKLDDLLLLNHLYLERRTTTVEAADVLQKSDWNARSVLERLVEGGFIETRDGKERQYHLSASTYGRLGKRSAYVRTRGFEPIQQEQMVLQYVEKHGSISRSEVAELCHLDGPRAYRLLKRLKDREQLHQTKSKGKGVRYEKNRSAIEKMH